MSGRGRRERLEAPRPVSRVARAPCDRQDGGGRVPYGEAAILGHPADQQAACQPHEGGRPPKRVLQDLYLPPAGSAVPLGGDADQDAHHGLPGHSHQAAERGGGRRAGRRAAGRGHHLHRGRQLSGAGVLAPPGAPAPQGGGAACRLGSDAGRGGPPGAGVRGAAGAGAGGGAARRPGGAAGADARGARPAQRPGRARAVGDPGSVLVREIGGRRNLNLDVAMCALVWPSPQRYPCLCWPSGNHRDFVGTWPLATP